MAGYGFDEEREVGTFTVASDSSRVNNPDLLYSFSLAPADCHVVVNFEEITGLPEGMKVTRNPYPLLNGGRDIMLEIEPVKMPRPAPRKKSDLGLNWNYGVGTSHCLIGGKDRPEVVLIRWIIPNSYITWIPKNV